jgi:hypothetical protein
MSSTTKPTRASSPPPNPELVARLLHDAGTEFVITEAQAMSIATLLEAASNDPETASIQHRIINDGSMKDRYHSIVRNVQNPSDAIRGIAMSLEGMEQVEYLFHNPTYGLEEMKKAGMVDSHRLLEYQQDPTMLAKDTKSYLYFTFVSYATAGGYL